MRWILVALLLAPGAWAQSGRTLFNLRCAGCHGEDGLGGERAPEIGKASRKRLQTDVVNKSRCPVWLTRDLSGFGFRRREPPASLV